MKRIYVISRDPTFINGSDRQCMVVELRMYENRFLKNYSIITTTKSVVKFYSKLISCLDTKLTIIIENE